MSEPTKRPHTDLVEIRVFVPAERAEAARRAVAPFAVPDRESVPWREVYPDFSPGTALRGARYKEGLTQKALAARLGLPQSHISQMEHGKRTIGKAMARRLAEALGVQYRVFL